MPNIMTWAEKNAGKATARAEKSAKACQSMPNIMLWAEKTKEYQLNVLKSLPKHVKYNAMGREKRRKSDCACENVCQSMPNIMLWAEKITGEATECAEKSAQSMSNIMTWAEKNAGKAPERAKMSAKACQI